MNTIDVGRDKGGNFQSSRFGRVCDNGIRRRDGCSDFVRCEEPCSEDGEDAQGGIVGLDLNDGKIFTTMEWLMVFVKVPL